jgi:hypothetical protein
MTVVFQNVCKRTVARLQGAGCPFFGLLRRPAGVSRRMQDKRAGFVEALEPLGHRPKQAQKEYAPAHSKLAGDHGNVIRQAEMLGRMSTI